MSVEMHEGVVAFRPISAGREQIMLGRVQAGEISPTMDPRSQYPICFRILLPDASSRAWEPARDVSDARRQAVGKINDWMIAAGVRPVPMPAAAFVLCPACKQNYNIGDTCPAGRGGCPMGGDF